MGFTSVDNFVDEVTNNGKFARVDWMKGWTGIGTAVAGRWYDTTIFPGTPTNWTHGNYLQNWDFQGGTTNWTLGAGWAYTPATHLVTKSGAAATAVSQNTLCESGVTYKVTMTITRSAGSVTPSLGGTAGTSRSAAGTYIEDIVCGAGANAPFAVTADSSFAGTVDLVIVQRQKAFTPYSNALAIGKDINAWHGGNVSPDTKHIMNIGAWTNAAVGASSVLMVVDLLGCYPFIKTDDGNSQTLTQGTNFVTNGDWAAGDSGWTYDAPTWTYNTNAMDKDADGVGTLYQTPAITPQAGLTYEITFTISGYTVGGTMTVGFGGGTTTVSITGAGTYTAIVVATGSGNLIFTPPNAGRFTIDTVTCYFGVPRYTDGTGVRAFYSLQNLNGANAANFAMTYTNPDNTSGQTLGATVTNTASGIIGHMLHSGAAAGSFGPFLPLYGGDTGIRSVQAAQFSAAQATANGCVNLVLCKPLAQIPITTALVSAERDLMNMLPSLPQVRDGACLGFLVLAGGVIAATTMHAGYVDVAWG